MLVPVGYLVNMRIPSLKTFFLFSHYYINVGVLQVSSVIKYVASHFITIALSDVGVL